MSEILDVESSPQTFYAADSPARTLATQEKAPASKGNEAVSGSSSLESFASYDRDSSSWKTYQLCLGGDLEEFSGTWPRAGTMQNGTAYLLNPSAPLTAVTGSSWSRGEYPTPNATEYGTSQNEGKVPHKRPTAGTPSLYTWARQWPTPTASDSTSSGRFGYNGQKFMTLTDATVRSGRLDRTTCKHGGDCKPTLTPRFVEWLMGFPTGWTDLGHSGTP